MEPNLEEVSKMRAEVLVSRAVNKALTEQFQKEGGQDELFIVKKNEEGIAPRLAALGDGPARADMGNCFLLYPNVWHPISF